MKNTRNFFINELKCDANLIKVVNITVLLPYDVPENGGSDDGIWTKKNNLSRVLPGIALAAENLRNRNDSLLPSQSFSKIHDILPDWKITVKYADTHCDSTFGPLEAVRLRCNTGYLCL